MIDPKKTKLAKQIRHKSPLLGCRFDPSGKYVFAGAQDNTVQRWEWATGKKVAFVGHNSWIRALAFDAKGKRLFSADWAGKLLAWSIEEAKPKPILNLDAHKGFVRDLETSPDGKWLASAGNDHKVRLWSIPDLKLAREFTGHDRHVYNLTFHPDGKHLVSIDLKGVIKQWNLETGNLVREMDAKILYKYDKTFRAEIGGAKAMVFTADGQTLICAGMTNVSNAFAGVGNPLFVSFDWKTGKRAKLYKPSKAFRGSGWGVEAHPDGTILGVGAGGGGGSLWFWKPGQEKSIHAMKLPTNSRDLDLHPDRKHIAIAFGDGSLRVYQLT